MKHYNPDQTPAPEEWLALSEQVRIDLAEDYHRTAKIKLPNLKVHAVFHTIVENQIAENLEPIVRAMARLTVEGLDRHDAIHAITSVLAEYIQELFIADKGLNNYYAAIDRLTAKSWRGG